MKWKTLLNDAITILESANIHNSSWTIGGGTVLMFDYKHRQSKDIDIFFGDIQLLAYVNPEINDSLEHKLLSYSKSQLFTKYVLPEGEIDFIFGAKLTNAPDRLAKLNGHNVFLQHPVEIVAKKAFYRGDSFTYRDVYDLSIVLEHEKKLIYDNQDIFLTKVNEIHDRINLMNINNENFENTLIPYKQNDKINFSSHLSNVKKFIEDLQPILTKNKHKEIEY